MNTEISNYLDYYINLDNPQYAVLINGKWGSGKTYYMKKLVTDWDTASISKSVELKPIYLSLNGLSQIKSVNNQLKALISPILYSKGMNIGKEVLKGLIKSTVKINLDFDKDGNSDGNLSYKIDAIDILKSDNKQIKGNKILIFDDLERCKIELDELFGYLNSFVEHSGCKVIIVADEEKINDNSENNNNLNSYKHFKEKLIGQTFKFKSNKDSIVDRFIEQIDFKEYLDKNLILAIFTASKYDNLRTLKQSLKDYKRFIETIARVFKSKDRFSEFAFSFLAYFMIVYLELKAGNTEIVKFQNISFNPNSELSASDETRKYLSTLNEYKIPHSTKVFPVKSIIKYVSNGFIVENELNNTLNNNMYFGKKEDSWELLWNWGDLEDIDFIELRKEVWTTFRDCKINSLGVLLHTTGILIDLQKKNLFSELSESEVLIKSKFIADAIINNNENLKNTRFNRSFASKEFLSRENNSFKNVLSYCNKSIENKELSLFKDKIEHILFNLDDYEVYVLNELLDEVPNGMKVPYRRTSILENIDGKKLAKNLICLSNSKLKDIIGFFNSRYYIVDEGSFNILSDYRSKDITCLEDLLVSINYPKIEGKTSIKKYMLNILKTDLKLIIEKFTIQTENLLQK